MSTSLTLRLSLPQTVVDIKLQTSLLFGKQDISEYMGKKYDETEIEAIYKANKEQAEKYVHLPPPLDVILLCASLYPFRLSVLVIDYCCVV